MRTIALMATAATVTALAGAPAWAETYLVSGTGETSTYKNGYAPAIVEAVSPITEAHFFGKVENRDGKGTLHNLETCAQAGGEDLCFGIGQGDVVSSSPEVQNGKVCIVRSDLPAEYGFAFWNNDQMADYQDIRPHWVSGRITAYVSATSSGSLATLRNIEQAGGFDAKIETLPSWDAVVAKVKADSRAFGFTVRYPDPTGFLYDLVEEHGFTVGGMAERALRNAKHPNGEPVYHVNLEVPVAAYTFSENVTTPALGMPVVLFSNCPESSEYPDDIRAIHEKIAALPQEAFQVELGWMAEFKSAVANFSDQATQQGWAWVEEVTNP